MGKQTDGSEDGLGRYPSASRKETVRLRCRQGEVSGFEGLLSLLCGFGKLPVGVAVGM